MNSTLAYLRGRRAWLVENLTIWGADNDAVFVMAGCETVGGDKRIGMGTVAVGGQQQVVNFAALVDNRGNQLPEQIKKPSVVIIPRGRRGAFVKAVQGETGFSVAKSDETGPPATVDLMIFEMGQ